MRLSGSEWLGSAQDGMDAGRGLTAPYREAWARRCTSRGRQLLAPIVMSTGQFLLRPVRGARP
jgi:hypothetical protein